MHGIREAWAAYNFLSVMETCHCLKRAIACTALVLVAMVPTVLAIPNAFWRQSLGIPRELCIKQHCRRRCRAVMGGLISDAAVGPAAEAVQCQVCQNFAEVAWQVRRAAQGHVPAHGGPPWLMHVRTLLDVRVLGLSVCCGIW